MSYKFDPFTGKLSPVGDEIAGGVTAGKTYKTVDNAFLIPRTVTLSGAPLSDSEYVFFNGLLIDDNCYIITLDELILDASLPLKIGDFIDIRYLT